jgi:hypothetical protein
MKETPFATCSNGHEVAEGTKFCPECGAPIAPDVESPAPPPSPIPAAPRTSEPLAGQPAPLSAPNRKKMLPWLLGGAALLVAAIVVVLIVSGGSGHAIIGTFTLFDPDVSSNCTGSSGYDDISSGTSVTVRNETGKTLATSALGQGEFAAGVGCDFPFTIEDVPDAAFYRIEVSHRGEVEFSRAELEQKDWKVSLSLGG